MVTPINTRVDNWQNQELFTCLIFNVA